MSAFGLFEAKNRFSELVARAQGGEDVIVTKHGRPVASIVAYAAKGEEEEAASRQRRSLERIRDLRSKLSRRLSLSQILDRDERGA